MRKIKVEIQGIRPLLHNKFNLKPVKIPDPTSEEGQKKAMESASFKTDKGEYYVPADHVKTCIENAGAGEKFKGRTSYKMILVSGMFVKPDILILDNQKPERDVRRVVVKNGSQKCAIGRVRPIFNDWSLEFEIELIDDRINLDALKVIIENAGQQNGVGDGRAKGFGRFKLTKFESV